MIKMSHLQRQRERFTRRGKKLDQSRGVSATGTGDNNSATGNHQTIFLQNFQKPIVHIVP
jgi:hypothetical protein